MVEEILLNLGPHKALFLGGAGLGAMVTVMLCIIVGRVMYALALVDARKPSGPAIGATAAESTGTDTAEATDAAPSLESSLAQLGGMARQLNALSPAGESILGHYRDLAVQLLDLEADVRKTARGMRAPGTRVRKDLQRIKRTIDQLRRVILDARDAQQAVG